MLPNQLITSHCDTIRCYDIKIEFRRRIFKRTHNKQSVILLFYIWRWKHNYKFWASMAPSFWSSSHFQMEINISLRFLMLLCFLNFFWFSAKANLLSTVALWKLCTVQLQIGFMNKAYWVSKGEKTKPSNPQQGGIVSLYTWYIYMHNHCSMDSKHVFTYVSPLLATSLIIPSTIVNSRVHLRTINLSIRMIWLPSIPPAITAAISQ